MLKFLNKHKSWSSGVLRLFFGVAFVVAGLDKLLSFSGMQGFFASIFGGAGTMMLVLAIIIELAGGLMLLADWHAMEAAAALAVLILVAFVVTFKLGQASNFIGTLREVMVMNTGGGATAVNFAYLAGLLSLVFSGCRQCKEKAK